MIYHGLLFNMDVDSSSSHSTHHSTFHAFPLRLSFITLFWRAPRRDNLSAENTQKNFFSLLLFLVLFVILVIAVHAFSWF